MPASTDTRQRVTGRAGPRPSSMSPLASAGGLLAIEALARPRRQAPSPAALSACV